MAWKGAPGLQVLGLVIHWPAHPECKPAPGLQGRKASHLNSGLTMQGRPGTQAWERQGAPVRTWTCLHTFADTALD